MIFSDTHLRDWKTYIDISHLQLEGITSILPELPDRPIKFDFAHKVARTMGYSVIKDVNIFFDLFGENTHLYRSSIEIMDKLFLHSEDEGILDRYSTFFDAIRVTALAQLQTFTEVLELGKNIDNRRVFEGVWLEFFYQINDISPAQNALHTNSAAWFDKTKGEVELFCQRIEGVPYTKENREIYDLVGEHSKYIEKDLHTLKRILQQPALIHKVLDIAPNRSYELKGYQDSHYWEFVEGSFSDPAVDSGGAYYYYYDHAKTIAALKEYYSKGHESIFHLGTTAFGNMTLHSA